MLKSKLLINTLIQENDAAYLKYENSELEYQLVDSILQEALQLFEDEGDGHFKRNWGKYTAGLGVGGVLANGGTFGAGAQHATQSLINATKNIGHTAFDKASSGLDKSANYYSHGLSNLDPKSTSGVEKAGENISGSHNGANPSVNPTPNYYGNDGATINPDTAHRFSEDYSYRLGDAANNGVHHVFERAPGVIGGAAVGAGIGAALGKKFGFGASRGAKAGAGLGGLAGGTLPYLKGSVEDPAIGTMNLG